MSDYEVKKNTKTGGEFGVLSNVTLSHMHIRKPDVGGINPEPTYKAVGIVDEATGEKFKKAFPKASCEMIKTSAIEEKFKVTKDRLPDPEAPIHYVIKLNTNAIAKGNITGTDIKAGDELPIHMRPRLMADTGTERVDVTDTIPVGIGSKADITVRIVNSSYGKNAKLGNINLTEIVEYKPQQRTATAGLPSDTPRNTPQSSYQQRSESAPQQRSEPPRASPPPTKVDDDGMPDF